MSGVSAVPDKTVMLGTRSVSRQTLLEQSSRAAAALDQIGIREGDAIALLIRNDPCYFEILQAAAFSAPMSFHSTGTARRMKSATSCRTVRPAR